MGTRSADIKFSFHRVALAMVGQDWMDAIHRKVELRGRDPCARSVRTSPEITGHETSGRDPGREVHRAGTQPWWIWRTVCSTSLLKITCRPPTKVELVHGWQVIRNNRLCELYTNEYVPLLCNSTLWLALPIVLVCVGRHAIIVRSSNQNTGSGLLRMGERRSSWMNLVSGSRCGSELQMLTKRTTRCPC
jgi:hypothetical protein